MSNQNIKKSPGIEFALFKCTHKMRINSFGYLNSSLSLFYFYFATNLQKKIYSVRTLTAEPPLSPIPASTLLAVPPLPPLSVRDLLMTPILAYFTQ